mmetsp:Transcript_7818/g.25673  ORF Transcript_7818/g.25673 Transcript_7818/m.25673 type:complete len:101 (-) Transcript_7818:2-304(-)
MLERVFDMGTRNHDGYQNEDAKTKFVEWRRPLAENNQVALSSSIDLGDFIIQTASADWHLPSGITISGGERANERTKEGRTEEGRGCFRRRFTSLPEGRQ